MTETWNTRLRAFTPRFLAEHPVLSAATAEAAAVLHGSTTFGVDDPFSDLDVWLLVTDEQARAIESAAGTRFFVFTLEDKPGHFTVEPMSEFAARLRRCDFPLVAELRSSQIVTDPRARAATLIEQARRPMPEA